MSQTSELSASRIAALYDIHGNLPALEAVLDEVLHEGVDLIVVGGDVLPGPMSPQALRLLSEARGPVRFIRGNGDREAVALREAGAASDVPERFQSAVRWSGRQLTESDARVVSEWPETIRIDAAGVGRVLFCHATPHNDRDVFTRSTPESALRGIFDDVGAEVVVCGHTHMQFDRTVNATRVVNAGSVGMPFGAPGAYWLLIDRGIQLRRTNYDLARAAERIRATQYPSAEEFATRSVLNPPSEDEMQAVFRAAEHRPTTPTLGSTGG